jgi:anti-anti-sigma regulatory factor
MTAAISILSFGTDTSAAALVGPFTSDHTAFLARHLEALAGNVVLECERLDDLDASSASVLLDFRASRVSQGLGVLFRGIPPRCREVLLAEAGRPRADALTQA